MVSHINFAGDSGGDEGCTVFVKFFDGASGRSDQLVDFAYLLIKKANNLSLDACVMWYEDRNILNISR